MQLTIRLRKCIMSWSHQTSISILRVPRSSWQIVSRPAAPHGTLQCLHCSSMLGALRLSQPHTRSDHVEMRTTNMADTPNRRLLEYQARHFSLRNSVFGRRPGSTELRICTSGFESSRELFQARQICQLGGRGCSTDVAETALPRQASHTELVGLLNAVS